MTAQATDSVVKKSSFFRDPFAFLWCHRRLLYRVIAADLRGRYAGSLLGMAWLVLYTPVFLAIYAVVYIFIFKVRLNMFSAYDYTALMFCGLIPFLAFAESLTAGTTSIISNRNLVKNTLFPVELIPVKSALAALLPQAVGLVTLLISVFFLERLTPYALLLPIVLLSQWMFTLGLIWFLSLFNIYLRDIQTVIPLLVLILMVITPIAYTIDMAPPQLLYVLALNPLYYVVIACQDLVLVGCWPRGHVLEILIFFSLFFFMSGFWFFQRTKRAFLSDV